MKLLSLLYSSNFRLLSRFYSQHSTQTYIHRVRSISTHRHIRTYTKLPTGSHLFDYSPIHSISLSALSTRHLSTHLLPKATSSHNNVSLSRTMSSKQSDSTAPSKPLDQMSSVTEGKATIYFENENEVFYNKVQCFNRDMSTLMLKTFVTRRKVELEEKKQKRLSKLQARKSRDPSFEYEEPKGFQGIRILEGLSATGLRSIRYAKEIPEEKGDVAQIIVNDLDEAAVEAIRRNVLANDLDTDYVCPNQGDASMLMYQSKSQKNLYDVIDLDPYGSASPFIDGAVQCAEEGGLLAVTCTDKAALCGNNAEICFAKYDSIPLRGSPYVHEMAVRILLRSLATQAAKHRRYIVPVASFSIDFYVRVFVRVYTSPREVQDLGAKLSSVYHCTGCGSHSLQPLVDVQRTDTSVRFFAPHGPVVGTECVHCGGKHRVGGPIYSHPIHQKEWIKDALEYVKANPGMFATEKRIIGTLTVALEELPDVPLHYKLHSLFQVIKASSFKLSKFRSALLNAGYRVSQCQADGNGIKTDAPGEVVWDIFRTAFDKDHVSSLKPGSAGANILSKPPTTKISFEEAKGAVIDTSVARFLPNPEPNWGPKQRAVGKRKEDGSVMSQYEKRKLNQGKNQGKKKSKQSNGDNNDE